MRAFGTYFPNRKYNEIMQLTDLEDALYVLMP
jgi:hypothetical protein